MTLILALLACNTGSTAVPTVCDDLCAELVSQCGYEAYPTLDSCIQGCIYRLEEENADVEAQLSCVKDAQCDTFAVLECEHEAGAR